MAGNTNVRFRELINRQRVRPAIWDYSYILLRHNLRVFRKFKELIDTENKRRILDVGCGYKPWGVLFCGEGYSYVGTDYDTEKSCADYIAPADKLPFHDNEMDALIYSEVLEHVENISDVLSEMHRVSKDGALVFISSPFIFPVHGAPYDFQRLSKYFYHYVFKRDDIIVLTHSNSSLSTAILSFNLFIESTPLRILKGLKHIIYVVNNIAALIADGVLGIALRLIPERYRDQFYSMPIEYTVIVRIKK